MEGSGADRLVGGCVGGGVAMRLVVTGGRTFRDMVLLHHGMLSVIELMTQPVTVVIQGEADGADRLAKEWAIHNGIAVLPFPAKWSDITVPGAKIRFNKHGAYNVLAGHMRNQEMIDIGRPDAFLAMPGGTGTADMIERCRKAGLPGLVFS